MKIKQQDPYYRLKGNQARFKRPTLLIVGCGDVGIKLVSWLRALHPPNRLRIIATFRTAGKDIAIRKAGAIPLHLNLDSALNKKHRFDGLADWMINLSPPPNDSPNTDPRSARLVNALKSPVKKRWVYISTSGVYGDCGGAWVNETRPLAPKNARAHRRVAGEKFHRAQGACVLRAPGIYGHDRLPIERIKAGTPALRIEDDTYTNHIHALDLAILSWLAVFRASPGRVFNASDNSDLKMGDYFDLVADAFHLPRPPRLSRTEVAAVVSPMMLSFMSESRRLSNTRIKKELRVSLKYPTVEATLKEAAS
jgi:nucleoside-diphosphate-sugar epimerase